ncbi:hypothetical protein RB653_001187 [Dictyostelium firmibasis]|uniref:RBR-type E3 ubiquitin transferase n=1 Tax=Dictyostelium firmibasis TaxID=79012 RepID=A0AAN7U6Z7_9MYCE
MMGDFSKSINGSWLSFLNEIKIEEDEKSIQNQNIIDENEIYNNFLRNTNSNHSSGYKDIRNSFIFKEFPDSTIFNEEERSSMLKSIQTNTPTLEGIKSAENNYVRRLALKKNRFSLDNQDYKGSLKLKMASEEIDKLIFSLNTPRINGSDNINEIEIKNIDKEENSENGYCCGDYSNNFSIPEKSTNINVIIEEEEEEEESLKEIKVQSIPKRCLSFMEDDFLKNLDLINCRMMINNEFIEDIKDEEDQIIFKKEIKLNSIIEDEGNVHENQHQFKKEKSNEFIEIKETFMKLGEVVPARNEIKMDHLIELSIECEMLEECPICLNEIDSINVYKFSPCAHRYCVDCVRKYFTDLIFRQTEIVCPHPKCDSIVHDFKIKEVVGLTIFKKFEMYKHLKNLKSDNIIYCRSCQNPIPYKAVVALNCSITANGGTNSSSSSDNSISNNGASDNKNNNNGTNVVICDSNGCGTKHCIECLSLEHPDRTCKENQKIIHDALSPEELKTLKYLELNQIKQCPKCGVLCSKADGCEYVMCLTCNYQFCFLCLEVHDHNLANHVHGPKYQEEIITSDNQYGNYYNRGYQNGNKQRKLKKICKNILIGAGIVIATPLAISVVAVAAIPYGVYYLAKRNEERKKKKKTKKFEKWANGEYKRRKELGVDVSPYIEFAANNYAANHKQNK